MGRSGHGMTAEEFDCILRMQANRCGICEIPFESDSTANIDHDHASETPRGLLCKRCNFGLGWFRDSPEYLMAAVEYLTSTPYDRLREAGGVRVANKYQPTRATPPTGEAPGSEADWAKFFERIREREAGIKNDADRPSQGKSTDLPDPEDNSGNPLHLNDLGGNIGASFPEAIFVVSPESEPS